MRQLTLGDQNSPQRGESRVGFGCESRAQALEHHPRRRTNSFGYELNKRLIGFTVGSFKREKVPLTLIGEDQQRNRSRSIQVSGGYGASHTTVAICKWMNSGQAIMSVGRLRNRVSISELDRVQLRNEPGHL